MEPDGPTSTGDASCLRESSRKELGMGYEGVGYPGPPCLSEVLRPLALAPYRLLLWGMSEPGILIADTFGF